MESGKLELTGQRRIDFSGAASAHYVGSAGEHVVASAYLADGVPVYWPAIAGWVDLVIQTPHGFNRVQVKTCNTDSNSVRVRNLGCSGGLNPSDRYDVLAVVHKHRLWLIPATALDGKDTITLHPKNHNCRYGQYRKR
jgi:hypothetical protein